MKKCSKCGVEKELSEFYKDSHIKKDGLTARCKSCFDLDRAEYVRNNPDKIVETRKKNYDKDLEKSRKRGRDKYHMFREEYMVKTALRNKISWSKLTPDEKYQKGQLSKESRKKWRLNNVGKRNYLGSLRRKFVKQATPVWLTSEQRLQIEGFYKRAHHMSIFHEEKFHVDHICPIKGKTSCGLHVPWNLQILPAKENVIKGNKLIT